MFRVLDVLVGRRGLRGDRGSVPSLRRRALPQPPAGLVGRQRLASLHSPGSDTGLQTVIPLFPTDSALRTFDLSWFALWQ